MIDPSAHGDLPGTDEPSRPPAARWPRRLAAVLLSLSVLAAACTGGGEPSGSETAPGAGDLIVRGGTLLDGTGGAPVEDAVVVVEAGMVRAAGRASEVDLEGAAPEGAHVLDARGRWIVPGLVDAHVHYSQTGWFDGRPDAADVRGDHPYPATVRRLKTTPEPYFRAYLCSGVTATFDVGGYPFTRELQLRGEQDPRVPHVAAAGALLSTVDFWLNLPDQRQFVFMSDSTTVRETVASHAMLGSAAVKVWYITPGSWGEADWERFSGLVHLAGEEAERHGLPLIAHATGLREAKDALRAGARMLVHSVWDEPVDEAFLRLAREAEVFYVPTLMVGAGYTDMYLEKTVAELPYPADCVDEETREKLGAGIPDSLVPPSLRGRDELPEDPELERAIENLRRVHDAGITVATGTDAGNPGTLHGPSIHREVELMARAGMSAGEVLVASTRNAAAAMGRGDGLGTLEPGRAGDLLILEADPRADVRNLRRIHRVVKGGAVAWPPAGETGSREGDSRTP